LVVLLQVRLDGRLTDALGLGDIVFPSMLAGWAHRFDKHRELVAGASTKLLPAVMAGYVGGCVLLEVYIYIYIYIYIYKYSFIYS